MGEKSAIASEYPIIAREYPAIAGEKSTDSEIYFLFNWKELALIRDDLIFKQVAWVTLYIQ